jgi:hypothetical protein
MTPSTEAPKSAIDRPPAAGGHGTSKCAMLSALMDVLPTPERPEPLALAWPVLVTERKPEVAVRIPEREFRSERKGKESFPKGVVDERPLGTGNDHLLVAAHGRPEGAARDDAHERLGKAVVSARMPA